MYILLLDKYNRYGIIFIDKLNQQGEKEKMKKDSFIITAEGYLKLEEELNELKNVRRPQIIKALKQSSRRFI